MTTSGRKKKRKKPVVQDIELAKADSPAWQTKEGKNPKGGLNAKGRASAKAQGMNLKPPVKKAEAAKSPKSLLLNDLIISP